MKSFNSFILSAILLLCSTGLSLNAQNSYSVAMGPQYSNEVFFSLSNGIVKTTPRNTWDIGFYTIPFSAGIITNDGANVMLYTYPKAALDGWDSFDTTGMSSWKPLYNNTADWEDGAFNRNELGHPDYGWGVYGTTHDVVGDSLYLIQTANGSFLKLHIVKKISTQNRYIIRYANLDGSNEHRDTLDVSPYTSKQFMAFSFANGIVDREPDAGTWDLLFTRYNAVVMDTYYPVVGVLVRGGHKTARAYPVTPDYSDWSVLDFSEDADIIGHDWKTIDINTMTWKVGDSLAYFVRTKNGPVYKVVFTGFSGSGTGTSTFTVQEVSAAAIPENNPVIARVYPNPASDFIRLELNDALQNATAMLCDLSGRIVKRQSLGSDLVQEISLNGIARGSYILHISNNLTSSAYKVIVR